ncbi:MAG: hypothetical protein NC410_09055 [Oscillibacter sp.]|nr:hypothetical protein [Oscillibacter sp.]
MKIYRVQLYCWDCDGISTYNTKYFTDLSLADEYKKKLTDWGEKLLRIGTKADECIDEYLEKRLFAENEIGDYEFERLFKLRLAITELPQFQSLYWKDGHSVDLDVFEISTDTDIVKDRKRY